MSDTIKAFNWKGFLKYEAERAEKLYGLAFDCWRAGYKRTKCMELATAMYSDVSEEEWVGMFRHMLDEQLSGYANATN